MRSVPNDSSRGAVLILTAAILFTILIASVLVFNVGQSALVKAQLQRAVDVAAKDATLQYCSLDSCFEQAQHIAITALQQPGGIGFNRIIVGNGSGPVWENDTYKITIQRGYWNWGTQPVGNLVADESIHEKFYPFETIDEPYPEWQVNNHTIGAGIFANAVYVKVIAKEVNFFTSLFGVKGKNFVAESLAVAGVGDTSSASPLAIPIESIVSPVGSHPSFNPEELCKGDIYFTDTEKADAPSDSFPGFMWEPTLINTSSESCSTTTSKTFAFPRFYDPRITAANISKHKEILNNGLRTHFGYVGNTTLGESESSLLQQLMNRSTRASIGENFFIYKDGFTLPDSDNAIWNWILNGSSSVNSIDARPFVGKMLSGQEYASACKVARVSDTETTVAEPLIRQGACNSKRITITSTIHGYVSSPTSPQALVEPGVLVSEGTNGVPVAKVKVPLISKGGSLAVSPEFWGAPNQYEANTNYKVVGFLTVYLYDVDIGHMPYELPSTIETKSTGQVYSTEALRTSRGPWSYLKNIHDKNSVAPCNVIRARIDCNASLIPSASDFERTAVVLVK